MMISAVLLEGNLSLCLCKSDVLLNTADGQLGTSTD